jgi:hypothetical protein
MQPPATPVTPKKDLTIRPRPQLQPRKRVGTPLAREILNRNWEKQVEKNNGAPMNIDESDAERGRPGKAPRLTSPPPTLMHSRYAGASAMAKRREDDRGENEKGGRTKSLPNPQERQLRRRGRSEGSHDRVTELHQQKTFPSGQTGCVRVDAPRQSRQRHPGGELLRARRQYHASNCISPSDRRFAFSSRSVGRLL